MEKLSRQGTAQYLKISSSPDVGSRRTECIRCGQPWELQGECDDCRGVLPDPVPDPMPWPKIQIELMDYEAARVIRFLRYEQEIALQSLFELGYTIRQVALELGCSYSTAQRFKKEKFI